MSTKRMEELLAERDRIDKEIEAAQAVERQAALRQMRYWMTLYQITVEELTERVMAGKRPRARAAPKYWNPQTGQTWSGRGRTPLWLVGQDKAAFRLDPLQYGGSDDWVDPADATVERSSRED